MNALPNRLTADGAEGADKAPARRASVSASSAKSAVKNSGLFVRLLASLFPVVGGEIEVVIAENLRGGFSIFPHNAAARTLFQGDADAGNFGTYADAWRRAVNHNCWTVVEPARAAA